MWQTLEDGSVDVNEHNGDEGDDEKLVLPVVGVDEGQRRRESELHFDICKHCLVVNKFQATCYFAQDV